MRNGIRIIGAVVLAALVGATLAQARDLTLEQRVTAQRSIEQVYYRHQIGATKPFEEAVPRAVIEGKARKYVEQTVALDVHWKTKVTDLMLQRELERMAGSSRAPDRLKEIFAALGSDLFLIKECLARPILVDRLTRNFYAYDATLHADARRRAEELRVQLVSGAIDRWGERSDRTVVDLVVGEAKVGGSEEVVPPADLAAVDRTLRRTVSADEFRSERARLPETVGRVSAVEEERDAFVVRVVLSETRERTRVASYTVSKTSWDTWWATARQGLRDKSVAAVASDLGPLPDVRNTASASTTPCDLDDTWDDGGWLGFEAARVGHTAVWTGNVMIVWGGSPGWGYARFNTGARYDPATDTWAPMSTEEAPIAAQALAFTAVWTGSVMVVWGGGPNGLEWNTGGRYDPVADTWSPTSTVGAPAARFSHTAIWAGTEMVVWGGQHHTGGYYTSYLADGGRYDPVTDTWRPTSLTGAPSARTDHKVVWTGASMLVWGGYSFDPQTGARRYDDGYRYDPVTDTWALLSTAGAPPLHGTPLWTGRVMLMWNAASQVGGQYDPATDTWTPMSSIGAPSQRTSATAIWTGRELVVWGGIDHGEYVNTGGRYDPATDTWRPTSIQGAPNGRGNHTAVWAGTTMVVWGGWEYDAALQSSRVLDSGGRYDPLTNTWTPTSIPWGPSPRVFHGGVWTGSLMIIWAGTGTRGGNFDTPLNTGGRYDPATDTWTPTSIFGAPGQWFCFPHFSKAIWAGQVMLAGGSRYDPVADTWTVMSNPPVASQYGGCPDGAWTGREVIVWGMGRYDPAADAWKPMSMEGAPSPRFGETTLWTGRDMVVWGGMIWDEVGNAIWFDTGGRYDPVLDAWRPTSTTGAPSGRYAHTAVWTGREMVVWGGHGVGADGVEGDLDTGGRYDPLTDTWQPTSTVGASAPSGGCGTCNGHTAIWTGFDMLVWGEGASGRYDPAMDTWRPMSPWFRNSYGSTAVWTGDAMIVWGGWSTGAIFGSGARYFVADTRDQDGDGVCDAADQCPATLPAPTVVIDSCDSGVANHLFPNGCSFGDKVAACRGSARNHGQFVSCVTQLVNGWRGSGLITGQQGSRITRCAAQSRR